MAKGLKIAINMGGGDAPGLNAVTEGVTLAAINRGWEVYGIKNSYQGLLDTDEIIHLTPEKVWHISSLGGTILGTTNKGNPFQMPITNMAGETEIRDVSDKVVENFKRLRLDCLIAVGGDGSLGIAYEFFKKGIPVVGVPKTIDNDLAGTVITFGFDTAVNIATEAIDRLHSTARSHERVMVVEVMGRHAGWIALNSGISGSADVILIPEIPFDLEKVCDHIMEGELRGQRYAIVVAAEGAKPLGGKDHRQGYGRGGPAGRDPGRRGGVRVQGDREKDGQGFETPRAGPPPAGRITHDLRPAACRSGSGPRPCGWWSRRSSAAWWRLDPPKVKAVPLEEVIGTTKQVTPESDIVQTARDIGISFGD